MVPAKPIVQALFEILKSMVMSIFNAIMKKEYIVPMVANVLNSPVSFGGNNTSLIFPFTPIKLGPKRMPPC